MILRRSTITKLPLLGIAENEHLLPGLVPLQLHPQFQQFLSFFLLSVLVDFDLQLQNLILDLFALAVKHLDEVVVLLLLDLCEIELLEVRELVHVVDLTSL